ncbi:MAG: DUF2589 domain-containing protein [Bacteroidales bacterium]|jgi:hypothetical protein|nr:DUF2589 domain-containing protein [Bacteroidales bacterium]
MDDSVIKSANGALEKMNFGALLGAPLKACVDAQAQAATATSDYIDRVCFKYNPQTNVYETETISFTYTTDEGEKRITVPLISVMPIPYIQIRHVDLKFAADVSVSDGQLVAKVATENNSDKAKKEENEEMTTDFKSDLKVDINIKASSADMPMGVARLLQFMQQNINVKEASE